jgi:hypothetical protein
LKAKVEEHELSNTSLKREIARLGIIVVVCYFCNKYKTCARGNKEARDLFHKVNLIFCTFVSAA